MQVPAPFDYVRAATVEEAIDLLARHGPEARLLAGGHSLLPMMKLRLARPDTLIDINSLADLDYVRLDGDEIAIGALTRHSTVKDSALLAEHYRMFAEAESHIADPIVRNWGTVGGSLCQADPAEDLPAVLSALGATVVVRSARGSETIPVRQFHIGPYETRVQGAQILVEARVPVRPGAGSAYYKVERRAGDWGIAGAGAFVVAEGGRITDVGIGITAVGAEHFTCPEAEASLAGQPVSTEALAAAAAICRDRCRPSSDQRGPEDYKRHLVGELVRRALVTAAARAEGREG